MSKEIQKLPAARTASLRLLLSEEKTKERFNELLGKRAPGFISSILSATANNKLLGECEPQSIITAAAMAASLDLPINANLGMAALIPFREGGVAKCQFQIMTRGYTALAIRSGQYRLMNTAAVHEGMLKSYNRITGEMEFDPTAEETGKIVGYVAYLKMLNGFEKFLYMTVEQIEAHAKRYSKAYQKGYGPWKDDRDAMSKKTVLKLLLSKWGLLSIEIQHAIQADQATDVIDGEYVYEDAPEITEETTPETPRTPKKSRIKEVIENKKEAAENVVVPESEKFPFEKEEPHAETEEDEAKTETSKNQVLSHEKSSAKDNYPGAGGQA